MWILLKCLGSLWLLHAANYEATLSPVATAVSGSLEPFVLAVDGKKLVKEDTQLSSISINGKALTPRKSKGRPFYTRVDTDEIQIEGVITGQPEPKSWALTLPAAEIKSSQGKIVFKIIGTASRVTVDGKAVPYKGSEATWEPPSGKKAFAKTFVLEMSASGNKPGRLYNLKLAPGKEGPREVASYSRLRIGFSPADFRVSQISVFQSGGGNTFSGHLAWAPYFFFTKSLGVGVELGASYFKDGTGNTGFFVADYELAAGYFGDSFAAELRGGAQSWFNFGGTSPVVGTTFSYLFSQPWVGVIDRAFLAYSYFLSSPDPAHQVRIGLGISL